MRLDFAASVSHDGSLKPHDLAGWRAGVARFRDQQVTVSLESQRITRSSQQNRWYWSCVAPLVAEVLSVGREVPLSRDQAHYVAKSAFLGVEETPLGPIPKSTRLLSTKEFFDFCERVCGWLATEHGVVVPQPGDPQEVSL